MIYVDISQTTIPVRNTIEWVWGPCTERSKVNKFEHVEVEPYRGTRQVALYKQTQRKASSHKFIGRLYLSPNIAFQLVNEFSCIKHCWGEEQNRIANGVCVDDWTAEWEITASATPTDYKWNAKGSNRKLLINACSPKLWSQLYLV